MPVRRSGPVQSQGLLIRPPIPALPSPQATHALEVQILASPVAVTRLHHFLQPQIPHVFNRLPRILAFVIRGMVRFAPQQTDNRGAGDISVFTHGGVLWPAGFFGNRNKRQQAHPSPPAIDARDCPDPSGQTLHTVHGSISGNPFRLNLLQAFSPFTPDTLFSCAPPTVLAPGPPVIPSVYPGSAGNG